MDNNSGIPLDLYGQLKRGNLDLDVTPIHVDSAKSFPSFIDEMKKSHKVSKKLAAARSCLNEDYAYKIMNGNKVTTERDYILCKSRKN